jgi:hypothetical protein
VIFCRQLGADAAEGWSAPRSRHSTRYRLRVRFANGETRDVDVELYLRGPVFEPIRKDRALFEAVTVDEELGVVVWPNGADIDSAVLYGAREPAWAEEEAGSPGMVRERRSQED